MSGAGKVVCVTGASGYIGSWIVKFLLQRGYTVNASFRDPNDPKKTKHLLALDGAKERLHIFKTNLLEEGSFDSVVDGCEGVFHTASPFRDAITDPQAGLIDPALKGTLNVLGSCARTPSVKGVVLTSSMAAVSYCRKPRTPGVVVDETWFSDPELLKESKAGLIDPALKGTLNVLGSCARTPSVKGVVLTSSMAAVSYCRKPRTPGVVVDETWFSDPELLKESKNWYVLSKTLAEDAAWKFVKEKSFDIVTIHPGMAIGAQTFPNATYGWVNVKDVANAHIQAFEIPSATGRYCLAERVVHFSEIVKILHKLYPAFRLPDKCADDKPFMPLFQISKEKAKGLGIDHIPLEVSLKEIVESLREKKFFCFSKL